jgi:hypothetical protein
MAPLPESMAIDPTKATWARSENTPGWVSVHQGSDELILEGDKIATP